MEKAIEIKRRAQRFIQSGDVDAALGEYEKLARTEENEPYHSVVIADLLFKKGDAAGAARRYLIAVDGYDKSALYKNGIAVCKKMARLNLAPGQVLQRLAQLHQGDGLATEAALYFMQHAEYALRMGESEAAANSFRQAFTASRENIAALERLAELHVADGDLDPAQAALKEAIEHYDRTGQIVEARRCRERLGVIAPHAALAASHPESPAPPALAPAAPVNSPPLTFTRPIDDASPEFDGAGVQPAEPRSTVDPLAAPEAPLAEAETELTQVDSREAGGPLAAETGSLEDALRRMSAVIPAVADSGEAPAEAASESRAAAGIAGAASSAVDREERAPLAEAGASPGGVAPDAAADPPRPGLAFSAADPAPAIAGDDVFRGLIEEVADSTAVLGLVMEAQEQYRAGARDEAVRLLVRAAQACDASGDAHAAGRVYRTMREHLPVVRPALMLWFDNCRRRGDRIEAARVCCDLGDEALQRRDRTTAREWVERACALDPTNSTAAARLKEMEHAATPPASGTLDPTPPAAPRSVPPPGPRSTAPRAPIAGTGTPASPPRLAISSLMTGPAEAGAAGEDAERIKVTHGYTDEVHMGLDELVETFRRGVHDQVSGDAESHYALGVSYLEMGLVDQAVESLRSAAEDPRFRGSVCELIGRSFMDQGRFEEAVLEFGTAIAQPGLTTDSALNLRFELALALEAAGRFDEALVEFERIYSAQPSFPDVALKLRVLRKTLEHE